LLLLWSRMKMASVVDDHEESLLEGLRTSLLDIIEEKHRTLNKKSQLHRMVVISKICHQSFQDIGSYYEKFFRDVQNQHQSDGVTGLLLIYPKHSVHVIESSLEVLLELCRDLRKQANGAEEAHMEKSKILLVSHDILNRLYQHWSFRVLDIEAPRMEDYDPGESAANLVIDMQTQLLKLGAYLARQPKVNLKNAMDSLHEKVPEMLPQQGAIGYLLESTMDTGCIESPNQYLQRYETPYEIVLDSELVWPLPVKLFPYN